MRAITTMTAILVHPTAITIVVAPAAALFVAERAITAMTAPLVYPTTLTARGGGSVVAQVSCGGCTRPSLRQLAPVVDAIQPRHASGGTAAWPSVVVNLLIIPSAHRQDHAIARITEHVACCAIPIIVSKPTVFVGDLRIVAH